MRLHNHSSTRLFLFSLSLLGLIVGLSLWSRPVDAASAVSGSMDYGFISILPPIIALTAAFLMRQVIVALFLGIVFGAIAINGFTPLGIWNGILDTGQVYAVSAMADADHVAVILFTLFIAGMTGVISKNGGMAGIVKRMTALVKTRQHGQIGAGLMGLVVFFDDYTNTLVVGNSMRPITDRLKISREKLSYIVDSTAAPVASIALISTWVGYEVGLISSATESLPGLDQAYLIFLQSIPYNFYPILALAFVFMVGISGRDFGPMLTAERRSQEEGAASGHPKAVAVDEENVPDAKSRYAIVPIVILVVVVIGGMYATGEGDTLRGRIGSANSFAALLWASLLASLGAIVMTVARRIMSLADTIEAWVDGLRALMEALVILMLSWTLAEITGALGTADYVVGLINDTIPVELVPALTFVVAGLTALGTGTSWGTMAILMPLVVPVIWTMLGGAAGIDPSMMPIIFAGIGSVLAGAVWGDHCSPISDTTILSSLSTSCDHMAHVKTQMPYALLVGGVAIFLGLIPTAYGVPWWICLPVGAASLWVVLRRFGRAP